MAQILYYAVPKSIAKALGMEQYRLHDDEGYYLLSAGDLRAYTITRALSEGAIKLSADEAKKRFKNK